MKYNWENEILGFIRQEDWLDVGLNVVRPNDPTDGLFADEKSDNLVARWETLAAEYQLPMMAQFHAFDTQAQTTFRVPVDTHSIEKGLIKVKINQSERMRALLRSGIKEDALFDYVVNDGARLAEQVFTRSKVAKNELLATGKVTIKENNLDLTVNYGLQDYQTAFDVDLSPESDIPTQIQNVIDTALEAGKIIDTIITSRKVLSKLRANKAVQTAIQGVNGVGALVSSTALTDYLRSEFGINRVITNDLTYGVGNGIGTDGRPAVASKRYFPDDVITFAASLTSGRLGAGLWGDPPEADAGNFIKVSASGVSPYVFVSQYMEWDPTVLWTKASGLFMPVLFDPASLWIAHATAAGLEILTVSSAAGTASGATKLTVSPAKGTGNQYRYKAGAVNVAYNQSVRNWTAWDGASDITAATGTKITVVECDAGFNAKKSGVVTVTAKA